MWLWQLEKGSRLDGLRAARHVRYDPLHVPLVLHAFLLGLLGPIPPVVSQWYALIAALLEVLAAGLN